MTSRLPKYLLWLAQQYKRVLLGSILVGIVTSYFVSKLQERGAIPPSWWFAEYLLWIGYVVLLLGHLGLHQYQLLTSFRTLQVGRVVATWYLVGDRGDISSDFLYEDISNSGSGPVSEFRPDREGFFLPVSFEPRFFATRSSQAGISLEVAPATAQARPQVVDGAQHDVHFYESLVRIVPPLSVGASLTIQRSYDVAGSERAAFSTTGHYAGARVFYPTHELHLDLRAPAHYRIELLSYHVANERGQEPKGERWRAGRPRLGWRGSRLEWRVLYPKNDHRYWLKYRLLPLSQ